jgi:hypothetical protein
MRTRLIVWLGALAAPLSMLPTAPAAAQSCEPDGVVLTQAVPEKTQKKAEKKTEKKTEKETEKGTALVFLDEPKQLGNLPIVVVQTVYAGTMRVVSLPEEIKNAEPRTASR